MIEVNGVQIETDAEGFLSNLDDWTEEVAVCLSQQDKLELGEKHWQVINWIRTYYAEYGTSPNLRIITKNIGNDLGEEFGDKK